MKKLIRWLLSPFQLKADMVLLEAQKKKLARAYQNLNKAKRELKRLEPWVFADIIYELELKTKIIYLTLQELNDSNIQTPQSRLKLEYIVNMVTRMHGKDKINERPPIMHTTTMNDEPIEKSYYGTPPYMAKNAHIQAINAQPITSAYIASIAKILQSQHPDHELRIIEMMADGMVMMMNKKTNQDFMDTINHYWKPNWMYNPTNNWMENPIINAWANKDNKEFGK